MARVTKTKANLILISVCTDKDTDSDNSLLLLQVRRVIFIGGVGSPNEYVGGELTKNKNMLSAIKASGRKACVIDTHDARRKLWRLIPIPFVLLLHPKTNVILSTHIGNVYWLIRWFSMINTKRRVTFIGTGGAFSRWILEGKYNAKYFRCLHKIVVQGQKMKEELAQVGLNQSYLLPNSKMIDYMPELALIKKDKSKTRFVFMSRMQEEKGIELILECARRLNDEGYQNQFSLDYYGLFEDRNYKVQFLDRLSSVPNASFNGVLNLRTTAGYDELASYDIMLFPSWWRGEGFPGIIIDALISGLPIIISDWNFNADYVVEGETGFLINTNDAEALYRIMLDAICNKEKYQALAKICQERARDYDARNVINEAFFEEIGI